LAGEIARPASRLTNQQPDQRSSTARASPISPCAAQRRFLALAERIVDRKPLLAEALAGSILAS
jgi:hypothetical protein